MSTSPDSPALPPVVVLCGGLGTRLRSVVADRPKVLAPVAGHPFLHHLLARLRAQGARRVVLSTGYLGEMVADFVGDGQAWDLEVTMVQEPAPLGTGGALRYAAHHAGLEAAFLALNGDTFFAGQLAQLVTAHQHHPQAKATLALVEVADAARYGTVRAALSGDPMGGAVEAFEEKQPGRGTAWINAGAYVLEPHLLAAWKVGTPFSLEREAFPQWIGAGLYACPFPTTAFLDIGTPADYARAAEVLTP